MELRSALESAPPRHLVYGLNPLISILRERDIDPQPLLEVAHIPLQALDDPTYQLTPHQEITFTEQVIKAIGEPDFGLTVGGRYHLSSYGMLGLAIQTSADLLSAMQVLYKNILMTWTYMHWITTVRGDTAYVSLSKLRDLGECHQYMIDRGLVASRIIFEEALGSPLNISAVYMTQSEPEYADRYRELFDCEIHFGANENCYEFPAEVLTRPLIHAEPETSRIYASQCERISKQLASNQTFSDIVRNYILASAHQSTSLEQAADYLNMTVRTLQRKLGQENTSYKELLEEVRRNLAIEYLQTTTLTLDDIADKLGYSDSSSFCHAYKRWTGDNPGKLRRHAVNG